MNTTSREQLNKEQPNLDTSNSVVRNNMMNYILFDEINMEERFFVSWEFFELAAAELYDRIKEYEQKKSVKFDSIYALARGGLCLGVKLSYLMRLPIITNESKITKNTLVVDDCTDTGKTLSKFRNNVTLTMFHKPSSSFIPTIFFKETSKQINFCWESKEERN